MAGPKKISSLKIAPEGTINSAVAQLLEAMKAAQLPEINVLYSPGSAEKRIPGLNLRNVTGTDALRLIAVSADCEAQPITGDQGEVIGYIVRSTGNWRDYVDTYGKTSSSARTSAFLGKTKPLADAKISVTSAAAKGAEVGGNPSVPADGLPRKTQKGPAAGTAPAMAADSVVVNMTEPASGVRVYSLGGLSSETKFPDIEATLRDVLKADGIAGDAAKFALHEKTNILVVTGNNRVHELVAQLLNALRSNQKDAEARNSFVNDVRRETTELKVRLNAEQEQKARLSEQLAKTDAQLRELERELARLKATAVKTP
jgi:hypothetical protein